MSIYADYCTLTDVRTNYLGTTATTEDTLLLALIQNVSREIDAAAARRFYPRIETRRFDHPVNRQLDMDDDLLAVTTFTNGDATVIASTAYDVLPYNETPAFALRIKASSTVQWQYDSNNDSERSLSVLGIWGWHRQYSHAWPETTATLAAAISSTTATTFTCTTGIVKAGDLLKLDSEYVYASSVSTGASDTVTCVRGVNGSTAATHVISSVLYRWWQPDIMQLCVEAAVAKFLLKNNPVGETVSVGGQTFSTPKDVNAFIFKRLLGLGALRTF